jgi:hypothetical protein
MALERLLGRALHRRRAEIAKLGDPVRHGGDRVALLPPAREACPTRPGAFRRNDVRYSPPPSP